MAQSDLGVARRLFDGHADGLLAPDRAAMAAQLGHLEFNDRVENETTRILQASPLRLRGEQHGKTATEPSPPDAESRLVLTEKIADPQLRAAVQDRVALQNQRDRQAYLTQQRQMKVQAKDIIDRGGAFTDIPYQMLIGIDATGKAALSAYARSGGKVTTDPVTFYRLCDQALDHPQGFLDTDLNDYIHLVEGKDMSKLSTLQATLKDKGPDDPALSLLRSYKANTDRVLRQLGLPQSDARSSWQQKKVAELLTQLDAQLSAYEGVTGRKASPAEQRKLLSQVLLDQIMTLGGHPGGSPSGIGERGVTAAVDEGERQAITRAFKAHGVSPTEGQIQRASVRIGGRNQ